MALGATRGASLRRASGMNPVESFKCEARCCCVAGDAVWMAELKGGIAVCDAQRGNVLERVAVAGEADERVQFKSMALVHDEVWAGTITGVVHVFDAPARRWKQSMTVLGVEATAPLLSLFFDGFSVLGGSETGRIVQWNPFTKRQVTVFVALAPVTAVTVAAGLIVSGDRSGVVQLWDPRSGEVVYEHAQDASAVTSLLAEASTGTLWVGRRNGTVSVYALASTMSFAGRVSVGDGAVTSMLAVSGKVLATSYDRAVVVFAARTREELSRATMAHDAFIHYASRVYAAETARIWTIGNDCVVHVWDLAGYFLPCQSPPAIRPCDQAAMVHGARGALTVENAQLSTRVAESFSRVTDAKEELRQARDEAHELRLRLMSFEHVLKEKDAEIASRAARVKELEEDVNKLQNTVTDSNARADAAQRETNMLRADYHAALRDASQTKTQLSAKIAEKAGVEQQLAAVRTENSHLEIRLRDREGEVSQLKAENARLHATVGQLSSSQSAERELQQKQLASTEGAMRQELEELRKRSQVLGGMLVSMEYTIRRKEEEERDMTALMNALRRRAAERVTDPHLAALLNLTMVRNPDRFEMECDEHTKSLLRDRNGPFIQFLQLLRDRDPQTYGQLLEYLQHPEAGSRFSALFDQLFSLAQKEGAASDDDIVNFKKSLPVLLDALNSKNAAGSRVGAGGATGDATLAAGAGGVNVNSSQSPNSAADVKQTLSGTGSVGLEGGAFGIGSNGSTTAALNAATALRPSQQQQTAVGALGVGDAGRILPTNADEFKNFLRSMNITVEEPDLVGAGAGGVAEDSHLRQLQNAFEFILQTRRDLVHQMGILLKRIVKARQVIDALTSNAREGSSPTQRRLSGSGGAHVWRQNLGSVATNMLEELQRFVSGILAVYFTAAEKQRLGIDA
ncbi:uncharacterized protein Tco025E_06072 [Trypanosoma conorhini]|uniref:Guanine nucleotide-binding protein subunit beta-like protein n=1 Tax=Trypanosoma conorhini TaxID=83891 RepID=A0A3S5ISW2_9TRYP|nr:uncharacterized protein Tco025E_06072 [Trypanosoma conorhini]RNF13726.1 hypothetical protein Tco025E_06072 [Trypanosoma conorhini]